MVTGRSNTPSTTTSPCSPARPRVDLPACVCKRPGELACLAPLRRVHPDKPVRPEPLDSASSAPSVHRSGCGQVRASCWLQSGREMGL
jgi:hypothetical protein